MKALLDVVRAGARKLKTLIVATYLGVLAILVAAIVALLVQRTRPSRTERDLRKREERLRLIVEETPALAWTMRPDPTLDFLNRMGAAADCGRRRPDGEPEFGGASATGYGSWKAWSYALLSP